MLGVLAVTLTACYLFMRFSHKQMPKIVKGERIVIIGASSGIGYQTALRYAARGARLLVVARRKQLLDNLVSECLSFPSCTEATSLVADITIEDDVKRISKTAKRVLGGCDTVVINAGVLSVLPFRDLCKLDGPEAEDEDSNGNSESGAQGEGWEKIAAGEDAATAPTQETGSGNTTSSVSANMIDKMFKTNVLGPIYVAKFFTDLLIESSGKFVVVSSLAGVLAAPTRSIYTSTKFAITGFFTSLRIELAKHNVSVCIIYPGSVSTDLRNAAVDASPTPSSSSDAPSSPSPPLSTEPSSRKRITPEQCADAIIRAADERARETFVPGKYRVGAIVRPVLPGLIDYFAAKKYGYT
ncbi:hypothetical protein HK097_004212 [Rhizophlyctis rosea]|uniref:Uncharacterized protein n=1 Tax=Rhizophlyctis rosea TaxID=64517 RepID=A0AAD5X784_9FUNG|nr:hypothetical protein HK097_004212 [Rhizophlyctis rosea]